MLDYQLKGCKEQSDEIQKHYERVDKEIEDMNKMLESEQNKAIMDDIKAKMERAKQAVLEYDNVIEDD